jgi:hypothetical protein
MHEAYHLIILSQLKGKGWVYKKSLRTDLDKKLLDDVLHELSTLGFIHLGTGNLLISSKGESYLMSKKS